MLIVNTVVILITVKSSKIKDKQMTIIILHDIKRRRKKIVMQV